MNSTVNVLGYDVSRAGLVADVAHSANESFCKRVGPFVVACANPHSLVEASSDQDFQTALHAADLLLPDGVGIVLASKVLGNPVRERVAGMEFFLEFSRAAEKLGRCKYFFLGSSDVVLQAIRDRLAREFPNIEVVGLYSPPFKPEFSKEDDDNILRRIRDVNPDVLWVGMTAPKQEKWINKNKDMIHANMAASIGAVFDFYAGSKARAPLWLRKIGLEWLPRLLREPKRLARRNFISSPLFVLRVLAQRLGRD